MWDLGAQRGSAKPPEQCTSSPWCRGSWAWHGTSVAGGSSPLCFCSFLGTNNPWRAYTCKHCKAREVGSLSSVVSGKQCFRWAHCASTRRIFLVHDASKMVTLGASPLLCSLDCFRAQEGMLPPCACRTSRASAPCTKSGSFFHPQSPSLLILDSEPG